jgi:hypothetical protein
LVPKAPMTGFTPVQWNTGTLPLLAAAPASNSAYISTMAEMTLPAVLENSRSPIFCVVPGIRALLKV